MSATLIATLGGLSALVGWGIGDWLTAKSSKKYDSYEVNAALQIAALIVFIPILLATHPHVANYTNLGLIGLSSLCFTFAYIFFIKAFSIGAVGVVAPIANSYPFFTLILAFIFLSTSFTSLQIFAMITVVAGAILLGFEKSEKRFGLHGPGVLYAVIAAVSWGFAFFILNLVVAKETWQTVQGSLVIFMTVSAVLLLAAKSRNIKKCAKKIFTNRTAILAGATIGLADIFFFVGSNRSGSILIPAVIGSAGPLVTSLLSAVVDKERLGIIKRAGAVAVVVGIILINVS